jgi:hypothetical protein
MGLELSLAKKADAFLRQCVGGEPCLKQLSLGNLAPFAQWSLMGLMGQGAGQSSLIQLCNALAVKPIS